MRTADLKATGPTDAFPKTARQEPATPPDPPSPLTAPGRNDWGPPVFVWGVWALLLLGGLAYVGAYGRNIPVNDDWFMVPALTGAQPLTPAWLWQQHNDHRIPLPKLILLALLKATSADFRSGMVFIVLALGAASFALIRSARSLRGRTSYTDALFPVTLLHVGHAETILWSWQVGFVLGTSLTCVALALVVGSRTGVTPRRAAGLAGCLCLLALSGPCGLAVVPAFALWLGYAGLRSWFLPEGHAKWQSVVVLALAALPLVLVGLYFVGYQKPAHHPPPPELTATLRTGMQVLSQVFWPEAKAFWPYSGVAVAGLLLLSVTVLTVIGLRQAQKRLLALGLLAALGGVCSLALGIGFGRGATEESLGFTSGLQGFQTHYEILAIPLLSGIYLSWELAEARTRRFAQRGLFILACLLFSLNLKWGIEFGVGRRDLMDQFKNELLAGTPSSILAERYEKVIFVEAPELANYLEMLHEAGIGPFRFLSNDRNLQEVPVRVVPVEMNQMTWKDGVAEGGTDDPYLVLALPEPRFVTAIRLTYKLETNDHHAFLEVFWKRSGQNEFTEAERHLGVELATGPGAKALTVLVNDTIDRLRIDPDIKFCRFRIERLMLLVPKEASAPAEKAPVDGSLDVVNGELIGGWAWDARQPNTPIRVTIYDGERVLDTIVANQFRQDLLDQHFGDGHHCFRYVPPPFLKDGKPHLIRAQITEPTYELYGSPMEFTFGRP